MKKQKMKGLSLNKKSISQLNNDTIKGGQFTGGCSDGCTPAQTAWNCTGGNCTGDCNDGITILCSFLSGCMEG